MDGWMDGWMDGSSVDLSMHRRMDLWSVDVGVDCGKEGKRREGPPFLLLCGLGSCFDFAICTVVVDIHVRQVSGCIVHYCILPYCTAFFPTKRPLRVSFGQSRLYDARCRCSRTSHQKGAATERGGSQNKTDTHAHTKRRTILFSVVAVS